MQCTLQNKTKDDIPVMHQTVQGVNKMDTDLKSKGTVLNLEVLGFNLLW